MKKLLALLMALVLALSLAAPITAAAAPDIPVAQALKMNNAQKNPVLPDTMVMPYAQSSGIALTRNGVAILEFKLMADVRATDLFAVAICRGYYDDIIVSDELDVVEERLYTMSDFQHDSIAITWKADSRYPVGEYTLLCMILDENGGFYDQQVYALDLYVVNQEIPATDMEILAVQDGVPAEVPSNIALNEEVCLAYALTPYPNTAKRQVSVSSAHPGILSARMDAGYIYLKGRGIGKTGITITCGNIKKTIFFTVGAESLQSFEAAAQSSRLCVGMKDEISISHSPANVPVLVEYKSENPEVATVQGGVVTAVSPGTADILVTCGRTTRKITYTVNAHVQQEGLPVTQRTATKPARIIGYCSLCQQEDAETIVESAIFTDTNHKSWYSDHVDYVYDKGIMKGSSATTFAPDRSMTRAELVTVLYRAAGSPEVTFDGAFTDVPDGTWYSNAVTWAAQNDIVIGVGGGRFAPTLNITREQIATILYRYTRNLGEEMAEGTDLGEFLDWYLVSRYAEEGMAWAVAEGLITGTVFDGIPHLSPKDTATRAQLATIISRYQQMFPADSE